MKFSKILLLSVALLPSVGNLQALEIKHRDGVTWVMPKDTSDTKAISDQAKILFDLLQNFYYSEQVSNDKSEAADLFKWNFVTTMARVRELWVLFQTGSYGLWLESLRAQHEAELHRRP